MYLAEVAVRGSSISLGGSEVALDPRTDLRGYDGRSVIVGIRPTDLEDATDGANGAPTIEVMVDIAEELGSEVNLLFAIDAPPVQTEETLAAATEGADEEVLPIADDRAQFCARLDSRCTARSGATVRLTLDPTRFHFFDPETGRAIETRQAVGATA